MAVTKLKFTFESYLQQAPQLLEYSDLYLLLTKAAVFGAIIPLVASYYGLICKPSAEGVGEATTKAVVIASVLIITLDFVITTIFSVMTF